MSVLDIEDATSEPTIGGLTAGQRFKRGTGEPVAPFTASGIASGDAVLASPAPPTEGEVVADAQYAYAMLLFVAAACVAAPNDLSKRLRKKLLAKHGLAAMMRRHDVEVSSSVHRSCLRALGKRYTYGRVASLSETPPHRIW